MVADFAYYLKFMFGLMHVALQAANNILLIKLKCTKSLQKYYTVQWESLAAIMFSETAWMKLRQKKLGE